MTLSEIHVVMTRGYATIAGSLLDAYTSFGVCRALLLLAENQEPETHLCGSPTQLLARATWGLLLWATS